MLQKKIFVDVNNILEGKYRRISLPHISFISQLNYKIRLTQPLILLVVFIQNGSPHCQGSTVRLLSKLEHTARFLKL